VTRAVVFAYHKVGVRCLKVLLAHGVDVPLVVTHEDSPGETIWFDSVAATAAEYGIAVSTPDDPNTAELAREIAACAPSAVRMAKKSIYRNADWDPKRAAEWEAQVQSRTLETEDAKEGVAALLEKREPVFKNQ